MKAPTFTLKNTKGEDVTLPEKGIVVLYFYPKVDTPGCTIEGKKFTELYPEFIEAGAFVFGVSWDPVSAVCDFSEKYGFTHTMLSDPDFIVAEKYGVKFEDPEFGTSLKRKTFLIQDGAIVKEYVHEPGKTEQEILLDVKNL